MQLFPAIAVFAFEDKSSHSMSFLRLFFPSPTEPK